MHYLGVCIFVAPVWIHQLTLTSFHCSLPGLLTLPIITTIIISTHNLCTVCTKFKVQWENDCHSTGYKIPAMVGMHDNQTCIQTYTHNTWSNTHIATTIIIIVSTRVFGAGGCVQGSVAMVSLCGWWGPAWGFSSLFSMRTNSWTQ